VNLIPRERDVVSGRTDLVSLHSFLDFPVFMGAVEQSAEHDVKANMTWVISRTSGTIQLSELIPSEILYPHQTTNAAIGETWMKHHALFANFVSERHPKEVFEIGGAHGVLAREYLAYEAIPWVILEPNPSPVPGTPAKFIQGFLEGNLELMNVNQTVVHSHVLEHVYEPDQFLQALSSQMELGQEMIFSVPDLNTWLRRKYTNAINFEHTVFLTEEIVDYLLTKNGFSVRQKEHVMDGHSIFYLTERVDDRRENLSVPNFFDTNLIVFEDFIKFYTDLVVELERDVNLSRGPVFLFGAHIFTQYLLAFGLDERKFTGVLDNDRQKQGKRLYGTNLMVMDPEVLRNFDNSSVIVRAGAYDQEIREGITSRIGQVLPSCEYLCVTVVGQLRTLSNHLYLECIE